MLKNIISKIAYNLSDEHFSFKSILIIILIAFSIITIIYYIAKLIDKKSNNKNSKRQVDDYIYNNSISDRSDRSDRNNNNIQKNINIAMKEFFSDIYNKIKDKKFERDTKNKNNNTKYNMKNRIYYEEDDDFFKFN